MNYEPDQKMSISSITHNRARRFRVGALRHTAFPLQQFSLLQYSETCLKVYGWWTPNRRTL